MNFCVIGPGAMGCLFAGSLARNGYTTVILDYKSERARIIQERGISIEGPDGDTIVQKIRTTTEPKDVGMVDVIIICVKSYDTERAALEALDIAGPETLIVTLQNGIGNVEVLLSGLPDASIVAGITSHGATVLDVGKVKHAGIGDTFLGLVAGEGGKLNEFAAAMQKAGFANKTVDNIQDLLWSKLIVNVGINALTAITRLKNGELIQHADTEALLEKVVQEAVQVGKREGVNFIYEDPLAQVKKVCELTAANVSSMLQDILRRKKTEIEFINGAIVERGIRLAIPTPVNDVLTRLVRTIQSTYTNQQA